MSDYKPDKLIITIDVSGLSLIDAEMLQRGVWLSGPIHGTSRLELKEVA